MSDKLRFSRMFRGLSPARTVLRRTGWALLTAWLGLAAVQAVEMSGTSHRVTRSDSGEGGGVMTSNNYKLDGSAGETGAGYEAAGSHQLTGGLMGIYFHPGSVVDLAASGNSADPTRLDLTWTAPGADFYDMNPAASYVVKYSLTPMNSLTAFEAATTFTQAWTPLSPGSAENTRFIDGLAKNTSYYVALLARDADKNQSYSFNTATAWTLTSAPSGAAFTMVGTSSVTLQWTTNNDGLNLQYQAVRSTDPAFVLAVATNVFTFNGVSTATVFTGLASNTTYYFRVRSLNSNNQPSPWSSPVVSTATLAVAPGQSGPPDNNNFSSVGVAAITANWTDSTNPLAQTTYQVVRGNDSGFVAATTFTVVGSTFQAFGSLTSNTTYYFRVRAVNHNGVATAWTSLGDRMTLSQTPGTPLLGSGAQLAVDSMTVTSVSGGDPGYTTFAIAIDNDGDALVFDTTNYVAPGGPQPGEDWQTAGLRWATGLTPNTSYYFKVKSRNMEAPPEQSAFSSVVAQYTRASPPVSPNFSMVGQTSMTFIWSVAPANPAGTEYLVERALDSGFSSGLVTTGWTPFTVTSHTFTGLDWNTRYFVRVSARNRAATPLVTVYASSDTYTDAGTPFAPTVGTLAVSSMTLTVNVDAAESASTQFAINVDNDIGDGLNFGGLYVQCDGTIGITTCWDTKAVWDARWIVGLGTNTAYSFRVQSRNGIGLILTGPAYTDGVDNFVYTRSALPGALEPAPFSVSSIQANWTANQNPGLTEFQAQRALNSSFTVGNPLTGWTSDMTNFNFTSLSNNTTYFFRVRSRNFDDTQVVSDWTVLSATMTHAQGFTSGQLEFVYQSSATFFWTDNNNTAGALYETRLSTWNGFTGTLVSTTVIEPTQASVVSGLTPNTTYWAQLVAYNGRGAKAPANNDFTPSFTPVATEPVPPDSASFGLVTSTQVTVSWLENTGVNNGANTRYEAEISSFSNFSLTSGSSITVQQAVTFSNLQPNTNYYARVRVRGHNGVVTEWTNVPGSAFTDGTKPAPSGFQNVTLTSLRFTFDANGNPGGTQYDARISSNATMVPVLSTVAGTTSLFADFVSLSTNTTYYCDVSTANSGNFSVTMATATHANQPGSISATAVHLSSAVVSWTAATNPSGTQYRVEASSSGFVQSAGFHVLTGLTTTFTGLLPNTTYTFRVQAANHSQIATAYRVSAGTYTLAEPPGAPGVTAVSSGTVDVSWTNPGSNPSNTGYLVERATDSAFTMGLADSGWLTDQFSHQFTGLLPNTTYYFHARARNQGLTPTAFVGSASTVTLSAPPIGVVVATSGAGLGVTSMTIVSITPAAAEPSDTEYAVAIDTNTDGLDFNVTGYVQIGGTVSATAVWQTASAWAGSWVTGLSANAPYFLKVKARNRSGAETAFGLPVSATVTRALAPSAPSFTAVQTNGVTFAWSENGNPSNTQYQVEIDSDTAFAPLVSQTAWFDPTVSSHAFSSGLSANTQYFARARARNNGGTPEVTDYTSAPSTYTLSLTPQQPTVDGVAQSSVAVNVVPASGEAAATTFAIAVDDDQDGVVFNTTNYVQAGGAVGPSEAWQTDSAWGSVWVTGLTVNKTYYFKVKARNQGNVQTAFGTHVSAVTTADAPPAPLVVSVGTGTVVLNVLPASGDDGTLVYQVQVDTDTDGTSFNSIGYVQANGSVGTSTTVWQSTTAWGNLTVFGGTTIRSNRFYRFRAKSRNMSQQESPEGVESSTYTLAQTPTAAPSLPAAANVQLSSMTVGLSAEPGESTSTVYAVAVDTDTNGTAFDSTGYVQLNGTVGAGESWRTSFDWQASSWVVGLAGTNGLYRFKFKARNGAGVETLFSPSDSRYTLAQAPVYAPTLGAGIGYSSMTVTVSSTTGDPSSTQYAVHIDTDGNTTAWDSPGMYVSTITGAPTISNVNTPSAWATFPSWNAFWSMNLTPNTRYFYRAVARNGANVVTAHGPHAVKHTLIETPSANSIGLANIWSSSFTFSWAVGSYPNYLPGTQYEVQLDTDSAFAPETQTTGWVNFTQASHVFTNLQSNTTYWVRVRGRNNDSPQVNSPFSGSVTAQTRSQAPQAPTVSVQRSSAAVTVNPAAGEPSDTQFAIAVLRPGSTDYVQADGTASSFTPLWRTKAVWDANPWIVGFSAGVSLTTNTSYGFVVRSRNSAGQGCSDGLFNDCFGVSVTSYTLAAPPAAGAFTSVQDHSLIGNRSEPDGNPGGSESGGPTFYLFELDDNPSFTTPDQAGGWTSLTSRSFGSLDEATTQYLRLTARNGDNVPSASVVLTTMTLPEGFNGGNITLGGSDIGQTSMTFTVPGNNNDTAGVRYTVDFSTFNGYTGTRVTTVLSGPQSIALTTGLTPNTSYWAQIRITNAIGAPAAVDATRNFQVEPQPTSPVAPDSGNKNVFSSSITLTWAENSAPDNPVATTRYQAEISTDTNFNPATTAVTAPGASSHTFTSLTPGTTYYMRVKARAHRGAAYDSPYLDLGSSYSSGNNPIALGFQNVTQTQLRFNWDENGNPPGVTLYDARISPNSNMSGATLVEDVTGGNHTFVGLSTNTTYYCDVSLANAAIYTAPISTVTRAAQPTGVASTAVHVTSAPVAWTSTNPGGTQFDAHASSNNFTTIAGTFTGTASSHIFTGLTPNTTYTFRARAVDHGGLATAYQTSAATRTLAAVPNSDTTVSLSSTSIRAVWQANGNPAGTQYNVERASDTGFTLAFGSSNWTTATQYDFTNLNTNTTYYFRVKARNADNVETAYRDLPASETGPSAPASGAPSNVTATSVQANWGANGNPATTDYIVERATEATYTQGFASATLTNLFQYDFTGLTPNTTYLFRVKARNLGGVSSVYTDLPAQQTLAAHPAPGTPVTLSSTQVQAVWTANSNPSGTQYFVERSTDATFAGGVTNSGWLTAFSYTFTPLTPNVTQHMRVKARNSNLIETAPPQNFASTPTHAATPLSAAPTSVTEVSVTANWGENNNPAGTQYFAERATDAGFTADLANSGWVTGNSHNFTGLQNGTQYHFRVRARNWRSVETPTVTLPSTTTLSAVPTGLVVNTIHYTSATVSWNDNGNLPGTNYNVESSTMSDFSVMLSSLTSTTTSNVAVTGLRLNATHYFRVKVNSGATWSNTATGMTLSNPPALITFINVYVSSLTVTAASNQNPVGTEYEFELDDASDMSSPVTQTGAQGSVSFASMTYTGLTANTTYYARARTRSIGGFYSSLSSTASVMTGVYGFSAASISTVYVSSAVVSFTDNPGNPSGTRYVVEMSTTSNIPSDAGLRSATVFEPAQDGTVTGLLSNATYYARVTAYNAQGTAASAGPIAAAARATLPAPPAAVNFFNVFSNNLQVTWTDGSNPFSTTRYSAEISTDSNFTTLAGGGAQTVGPASQTASFITGISANTQYYARVRTLGHSGSNSDYTLGGSTITPAAAPTSPRVSVASENALTFAWTDGVNGPGTQYEARRADNSGMSPVIDSTITLNLSHPFTGLPPNTTYFFAVRTLGSPSSNFTAAVGSPTWANQPAAAVTAFLNVWATSATVAWDANVNPAGTVYQVQASTTGFSTIIASAQGTATSATLTGLAPNQTNAFRVRAVNHANVPTAYLTIGSTVTQAAVPTLTLFTITTNTITAFWNANGNPAGTLYVASNTTAGTGSGATPATFWQSTGLSINSSYTFVARAINSSGDPTVYNTLGTRYTYAQTPGAAVNLGQSANQLRVGVSTGANPANTEYAIKVEDITGALISNPLVYYVQTPDGSNQSLLTGTTQWLTYESGTDNWRGASGVIVQDTEISANRQYRVSVVARNGDNVETSYGPTIPMDTTSGQPIISLAGKVSGDWVNTVAVGFEASGAFHYHYKFTKNGNPVAAATDPGWDGGIQGGAPLHSANSDPNYTGKLSGFSATQGQWTLTLYGDSNTPLGTHTPGQTQVQAFTINVDTTPPVGPSLQAKFSPTDPTPIQSGVPTPDNTPYFYWTNHIPSDNTSTGESRIVGWSYSFDVATNTATVPPMTADPTLDVSNPFVYVTTPQGLNTYHFKVRGFDAAGNPGVVSTFIYQTTPDADPPSVVGKPKIKKCKPFEICPDHDIQLPRTNTYVAINLHMTVTIEFSEAMNQYSLTDGGGIKLTAVRNNKGQTINVNVPLTITWDSLTNKATVSPADPKGLAQGYRYRFEVTELAWDLGNNTPLDRPVIDLETLLSPNDDNIVESPDGRVKLFFARGSLPTNLGIAINKWAKDSPMTAQSVLPTVITQANDRALQASGGFAQPIDIQEFNAYDENGAIHSGNFNSPVQLTMTYDDANNDGIVDRTSPPVKAEALSIHWLDPETGLWMRVPASSVDRAAKTVTANVRHFSVYGIIGAPSTDLSNAYAYPVPFKPSEGDTHITFTGLGSMAHIKVFTLDGKVVAELDESDGDGQLQWPVTNSSGEPLASDVYFYMITSGPEKKTGKLVVVR